MSTQEPFNWVDKPARAIISKTNDCTAICPRVNDPVCKTDHAANVPHSWFKNMSPDYQIETEISHLV